MASAKAHWRDHWDNHASQWSLIGSPLRPSAEDVGLFANVVTEGHGLLLGMTPELTALSENITAVDHNSSMIGKMASGKTRAVFAKWQELPFEDASFDYALGDGSLNMLHYADGYEQVLAQLARVVKPGGKFALRLFASPEKPESVAEVMGEALAGEMGSFHAFKWRFAMALVAEGGSPNIRVQSIYDRFVQEVPERDALPFPRQQVDTIEVYNNSDVSYSFPVLAQLKSIASAQWREENVGNGTYELAERCPVITFIRR